jgi:hypothetical protein
MKNNYGIPQGPTVQLSLCNMQKVTAMVPPSNTEQK